MTVDLRPYQAEAVANISNALRYHRRVLFRLPTGGGKTVIVGHMMLRCAMKAWREWFLCHRMELIDQTSATLHKIGLDHGFIAAGYPASPRDSILVCSVATIGRRIDKLEGPKIIFVDEAHHSVAGTWHAIINAFPDALIVGVTATPERLDGRGLGDIFTSLVTGPTEKWLMEQGYLSDFIGWTHSRLPDLADMKTVGADYDQKALATAMSDSFIMGDAVEHYMDVCPHARAVAFCVSVEHAYRVRDAFRAAGVKCEELDGKAPKDVRRSVIAAYRAGDIELLTSVDLFGEGFDLPEMRAAILLRPTKSLGMYLQQCGRAFRPVYAEGFDIETQQGRLDAIAAGPKPRAFLLDHAGNSRKPEDGGHGAPDLEREWSLQGRKKSTRDASAPMPRVCPRCFGASGPSAPRCKYCGWEFEVTPREVEERAGDLEMIQREQVRVHTAATPLSPDMPFERIMEIYQAMGKPAPWSSAEGYLRSHDKPVSRDFYCEVVKKVREERGYNWGWVVFQMRVYDQRHKGGKAA